MTSAQTERALDSAQRARTMHQFVLNNLAPVVSSLCGILLVPALLKGLSAEFYGLWIAALALSGILGAFDFGLGWTLTRAVARQASESERPGHLLATIANCYLLLGLAGGLVIVLLGFPAGRGLRLSAEAQRIAPVIFALVGCAFLLDQGITFAVAVLRGFSRFASANALAGLVVVVRTGGMLFLAWKRSGLVAIAAWYVLGGALVLPLALVMIRRLGLHLRWQPGFISRSALREHAAFGLDSQAITLSTSTIWQAAPLFIGGLAGSSAIVPFHIGQKISWVAYGALWRMGEVLFPAASREPSPRTPSRLAELLEVGSRSILAVALPFCVLVWLLAPRILQVWVGQASDTAVWVLRITIAAVAADAVVEAALHVLWGSGHSRVLLRALGMASLASLALTLGGVWLWGSIGAALALLLILSGVAIAFLHSAARICGSTPLQLLRSPLHGLALPLLACVAATVATGRWTGLSAWAGLLLSVVFASGAYTVLFYRTARQEERLFLKQVGRLPCGLLVKAYWTIRAVFHRFAFTRSLWYLGRALVFALVGSALRRFRFQRTFANRNDPWGYNTPAGQARLKRTTEMLQTWSRLRRFHSTLEIGCGEGRQTGALAAVSTSLLCVDISTAALDRARQAAALWPQAHFAEWDVLRGPALGCFDLVAVMNVLDYLDRPLELRAARERILEMIRPGGCLLFETFFKDRAVESAWWDKYLLRGANSLHAFMAAHPQLQVLQTMSDELCITTLFEKRV